MNNILMKELLPIQTQYKNILENAKMKLLSRTFPNEVLNEITSFWYRYKNIVHCALNWLTYQPFETYLFTAATNLDVDEKDHYPFVLVGAAHILDDPVFKFATTAPATSALGDQFLEYQKTLVMEAIEDNIKIIDNFQGIILILPISYIFDDLVVVKDIANKAMLGFFNDSVSSLKEINNKCKTLQDIELILNTNADNQIILNDFDDFKISLSERFVMYKEYQAEHGCSDFPNDASNFLFALYSHVLNASKVIEICTKFCLTPYLRYDVIFHYVTLILGSTLASKEASGMANLLSKTQTSHVICRVMNRELCANIDFNIFVGFCRDFDFESKLADKCQKSNGCSEKVSLVGAIDDVLNDFYKFCISEKT